MANSLGRNIEVGEVVVVDKKAFKKEYQDLEFRLVRVMSDSFGLYPDTMGRALFVQCLADDERFRTDAMLINREETEKWQVDHGKFGEQIHE